MNNMRIMTQKEMQNIDAAYIGALIAAGGFCLRVGRGFIAKKLAQKAPGIAAKAGNESIKNVARVLEATGTVVEVKEHLDQ